MSHLSLYLCSDECLLESGEEVMALEVIIELLAWWPSDVSPHPSHRVLCLCCSCVDSSLMKKQIIP